MSTDYLSYLSDSAQNRFHMAGASSGIDFNSMIDAEMEKASEPVKKLQEEQTELTNRQTALRNVSDRLGQFRTFVNDWKLQSNFYNSNSTSSDESVLTVDTHGSVQDTTFDVTVDQLSKNQSYYSTSSVNTETTTKLENIGGYGNGIAGEGTLNVNVNGNSYSIDYYEGNTLQEITDQIESLDDNLQVYAVQSSDGMKIHFSGVDAGVNLQVSDTGTLLETLNMTESYKSGGFVLGDPTANMDTFGITDGGTNGQLTINVDGTDYTLDYDPSTQDFDSWISSIYSDTANETLLEKVSIYYGTNGQTGDDQAMKLFINSKNPESDISVTETGDGNMLEMMRFYETYRSAERVTGDSTVNLDTSLGLTDTENLTFGIGGTDYDISYDPTTESLEDVAEKINLDTDVNGTVSAEVIDDGTDMQLVLSAIDKDTTFELSDSGNLLKEMNFTEVFESTSAVTGAATDELSTFDFTEDSGTVSINVDGSYRYVSYDASSGGDTLQNVVDSINASDSRVFASVEESGGNVSISIGSNDPDANISLSDTGDFLDVFNIDTTEAEGHHNNGYTEAGYSDSGFQESEQASATVTLGGTESEITSDTNTFDNVLEGVSFTAKQTNTTPVTVTVSQDLEATKEHIEEFVSEYNDIMDYLYERLYKEDDQVETQSSATDTDETDDADDADSEETDLSEVLVGDPLLRSVFDELKSMAYQDIDDDAQEMYYSDSMEGSSTSTLSELGVSLPAGETGTLTIHVDGFDDPIEISYTADDTVEDIQEKFAPYSDYNVGASIEESGIGTFAFKVSSPNDIIVTDDVSSPNQGLKSTLLTNHGDTKLKYDYLTEVGIGASDGFNDYEDSYKNIMRGRLMIDDTKLQAALDDDVEAVWEMFGVSGNIAGTELTGFATELSDKIYDYNKFNTGKLERVIGYNGTISQEVRRINQQIIDWSSRLNRKFESLWKKYSNLEAQMSRVQQQGASLQNAIDNLNGGNK